MRNGKMRIEEAWSILQLSPTDSKREIKRAYAKLAAQCHPEDAPEEFERLNAAYQCVCKAADEHIESEENIPLARKTSVSVPTVYQTEEKWQESESVSIVNKISKWEEGFEQWLEKLQNVIVTYDGKHIFPIAPFSMLDGITYVRENYVESAKLKEELLDLFEHPMVELFCFREETQDFLLDVMEDRLLPKTLAELFYQYYEKKGFHTMSEDEKEILYYLMKILTLYRRLPEYHCWESYFYENVNTADISENNLEFWEYFFAYGFGCRHPWGEAFQTLTGYMEELYQPSMEWRKEFTHFFEKFPVKYEFYLSDKMKIGLEFHLHYVLYYRDGEQVVGGIPFSKLCEEANAGISTQQFFFLLGMTNIQSQERYEARNLILKYLKRLPLYQPTIPLIAECLCNDCEPEQLPENERKRIVFRLYGEEERFAFRIQATPRKFEIHRYDREGWVEFPLLAGDAKAYKALPMEERLEFLNKKLEQLKQAEPILAESIFLEGMSAWDKTLKVIDALRKYGKMKRAEKGLSLPYTPGFMLSEAHKFEAMYRFFEETGGYMTNAYVILQLGNHKRSYFQKIFTVCTDIFGYDMLVQSEDIQSAYLDRVKKTEECIEEKQYLDVGRIAWANDEIPYPIIIGKSGMFYSFREEIGLIKAHSFEELVYLLFDFRDVTRIDIYKGCTTVSKLDHRVEYHCTNEDLEQYLDLKRKFPTLQMIFSEFKI